MPRAMRDMIVSWPLVHQPLNQCSQTIVSFIQEHELPAGPFSLVVEEQDLADLQGDDAQEILDRITLLVNDTLPKFNHGMEKREDGLHGKITSSERGVKLKLDVEVEFGKVDDLSFVLSAGRTKWQPNSRKEKVVSENSVDKLPPNDENSGSISSRD
ncbi:hypothetical protein Ancab_016747 [Ancistrocladus abbreviatus]